MTDHTNKMQRPGDGPFIGRERLSMGPVLHDVFAAREASTFTPPTITVVGNPGLGISQGLANATAAQEAISNDITSEDLR